MSEELNKAYLDLAQDTLNSAEEFSKKIKENMNEMQKILDHQASLIKQYDDFKNKFPKKKYEFLDLTSYKHPDNPFINTNKIDYSA